MAIKPSDMLEKKLDEFLKNTDSWSGDAIFNLKDSYPYFNIFINCSGKCGSMSLTKSFSALNLNVLHVHDTSNFLKRVVRKNEPYSNFSLVDYFKLSAKKLRQKVWVFDVVREPISRRISSFFQQIEEGTIDEEIILFNEKISERENTGDDCQDIYPLIDMFNEKYLLKLETYQAFNEWIRDDVDILGSSFANGKYNYISIDRGDVQYVVLRFKDIAFWEEIIRLLGFDSFKMLSDNLTHKKQYFSVVEKFKKHYYIPRTFFEYIYNIECESILNHFFDRNELSEYSASWKIKDINIDGLELPDDFNGERYVNLYEDLAQAYATKIFNPSIRNKKSWGIYHYLAYGKKEGRGYK